MSELLGQDKSEFNILFVHADIDDAGLSPAEFRVYAHLARRANKGRAWPGIDSIARVCRLSKGTVIEAIRALDKFGMLTIKRREGERNIYVLTKRSSWVINTLPTDQSKSGNGSNEVTPPVQTEERKCTHLSKSNSTASSADEVINIYNAYPKKVGKPAALKAIRAALKRFGKETHDTSLLEITQSYAKTVEGSDMQFIPNPSTWFNQERYNDNPLTWKPHRGKETAKTSGRGHGTANEGRSSQYRGVGGVR